MRVSRTPYDLLKEIARRGGIVRFVPTTSLEVAQSLGVSQQTASRWILDLEREGVLERRPERRGQSLRVTPKGERILRRSFVELEEIFSLPSNVEIQGKVVPGLGEGRYYMTREGYRQGVQRILGFDPFPGTLNVLVDPPDRGRLQELRERDGPTIPEFYSEGRTFGAVKCFPAQVRGREAGVLFPVRTHHSDVLEVVSEVELRKSLSLSDGDSIRVLIFSPQPLS